MELYTADKMRRNERLDRAMARTADTSSAAPRAQSEQKRPADRCTLSSQALAYLERQNALRQELEEKRAAEKSKIEASLNEMESREKQMDLLKKAMETMRKCMKIAASVMKGNRVPPEDLAYLMKNDPEGYKMAMALRRENPDPKEEKSVLTDEDKNPSREEPSGGAEPCPVTEAPAAGETACAQ